MGLSLRLEKNFGTYHALNSIVDIPIVLIGKKGVPAQGLILPANRTSVGLTVGISFSKLVY
ncbi:MAG: hypothetical protein V4577_04475 [Bacteroidota bacterium]